MHVEVAKRHRAGGGEIVLGTDDRRTLRVFEVTGLGGVFDLERSLPAAIDAATAVVSGGRP